MSIVEQAILIPSMYDLFALFIQHFPQTCSIRDLVIHQYAVSEAKADKWILSGLQDTEAHRELMIPIRLKIKKLRAVLKPFGISIETTTMVGYSLGRATSYVHPYMRFRKGVPV